MNIKHDFPYDPTNGLSQEELLKLTAPPEPAGFRKFWEETRSLAMEHKLYYHIEREVWSELPDCRIYVVRAKTWDNREIVMWISRPKQSRGGILIGQGYGNMSTPPCDSDFTLCCPNVRGLGLSQCRDIPWRPLKHVLHGIRAKETYVLRGVITDLWLAATILIDMYPDVAENLNYMGGGADAAVGFPVQGGVSRRADIRQQSGALEISVVGKRGGCKEICSGTSRSDGGSCLFRCGGFREISPDSGRCRSRAV